MSVSISDMRGEEGVTHDVGGISSVVEVVTVVRAAFSSTASPTEPFGGSAKVVSVTLVVVTSSVTFGKASTLGMRIGTKGVTVVEKKGANAMVNSLAARLCL